VETIVLIISGIASAIAVILTGRVLLTLRKEQGTARARVLRMKSEVEELMTLEPRRLEEQGIKLQKAERLIGEVLTSAGRH
jgi:hypothetical protein